MNSLQTAPFEQAVYYLLYNAMFIGDNCGSTINLRPIEQSLSETVNCPTEQIRPNSFTASSYLCTKNTMLHRNFIGIRIILSLFGRKATKNFKWPYKDKNILEILIARY